MENELLKNLGKIHTTELGLERIKKNLALEVPDVVQWCKEQISAPACEITRKGKNWYAQINDCVITVNVSSYTIITAHSRKKT